MRLNKISLKQLKKDLKKLNIKRRSRFGEDSSPLSVTGDKIELKEKPKKSFKDRIKSAPWKKIGIGLAAAGGVAAVAGTGHHIATKTEAGREITGAINQRVNYEKDQATQKINQAKEKAEKERLEAMAKLNEAVTQRAREVGRSVASASGDVVRAAGKVGEAYHSSDVRTGLANALTGAIGPTKSTSFQEHPCGYGKSWQYVNRQYGCFPTPTRSSTPFSTDGMFKNLNPFNKYLPPRAFGRRRM
jgi:hypothetical protein